MHGRTPRLLRLQLRHLARATVVERGGGCRQRRPWTQNAHLHAAALGLGCFAVYMMNWDEVEVSRDTLGAYYLAANLVEHGTLSIAAADYPFLFRDDAAQERWYWCPTVVEGRFANAFGIGTALAAAPFVAVAAALQHCVHGSTLLGSNGKASQSRRQPPPPPDSRAAARPQPRLLPAATARRID